MTTSSISSLLSTVHFDVDDKAHIEVDGDTCVGCPSHPCLNFCPAGCFTAAGDAGKIDYYYVGCLECGTCLIMCDRDAVRWTYPKGGYGISYRF